MKIREIDYTPKAEPLIIKDIDVIKKSSKLDSVDGRDVYQFISDDQMLLFFKTGDVIDAFVLLQDNYLRGIRNISGTPGLVTALVAFAIHKYGPITIDNQEPLSPEGFKWLKSLIAAGGRSLKITDQTGNYPSVQSLEHEWKTAMNGQSGLTTIRLAEGYYRDRSKSMLVVKPYYIHYQETL